MSVMASEDLPEGAEITIKYSADENLASWGIGVR
jgi:hypothetical protein